MDGKWTTGMVAERLEEAASTLRRLTVSGLKPREYGNSWPTIIHEFCEAYGWNEAVIRLGPPPTAAITRMEEALEWLGWLEPNQVRLVWSRAEKVPWKPIMRQLGVSRDTAWTRWTVAITRIVTRLELQSEKEVSRHLHS